MNITEDNVLELLPVADQYQFVEIVTQCLQFLGEGLNFDNYIGVHNYAKQYLVCAKLEEASLSFILEHFNTIIRKAINGEHEEFNKLTCAELEELLGYDELNVTSEEQAFEAIVQWIKFDPNERITYMGRYFFIHTNIKEYSSSTFGKITDHVRENYGSRQKS